MQIAHIGHGKNEKLQQYMQTWLSNGTPESQVGLSTLATVFECHEL